MRLLTGFAGVATLLAIVGLYGVLSLSVGSRMKELAVRKAIGAQGHQIVGLVIGEGSRLIAVGLVLGSSPRWRSGGSRIAVVRREARRSADAGRRRDRVRVRGAAGVSHPGATCRPRRVDGSAASGMTQRFFGD